MDDVLRAAIVRLTHDREAGSDAYPAYFMLHGVPRGEPARELAAACTATLSR
ncbi:hypothetical protein ACFZDK_53810 [Streptomyces sp. NPDC007901]|uniref:hypothetical protein n=1 Tax=Streptomyces sp. NPDC007901 TaxID=3364785 RepID=UPI0036E66D39